MICPNCGEQMLNLGSVYGVMRLSNPPQWDEVHVCKPCKLKKTENVIGMSPVDLSDFKEIDMNIDLSKLTPAPWTLRETGSQTTDAQFISLSRNAFDFWFKRDP